MKKIWSNDILLRMDTMKQNMDLANKRRLRFIKLNNGSFNIKLINLISY